MAEIHKIRQICQLQKDNYRCAPLAVLNALTLIGFPKKRGDLEYLSEMAKTDPMPKGTFMENFEKILSGTGLSIKQLWKNKKTIKRLLKEKPLICRFPRDSENGHYITAIGIEGGKVALINEMRIVQAITFDKFYKEYCEYCWEIV